MRSQHLYQPIQSKKPLRVLWSDEVLLLLPWSRAPTTMRSSQASHRQEWKSGFPCCGWTSSLGCQLLLRVSGIRFARLVAPGSRDGDRLGDTSGSIGSHTMYVEGLHIYQSIGDIYMPSLAINVPLMLLLHPSAHHSRFVIDNPFFTLRGCLALERNHGRQTTARNHEW